jgi:hypothetical protein
MGFYMSKTIRYYNPDGPMIPLPKIHQGVRSSIRSAREQPLGDEDLGLAKEAYNEVDVEVAKRLAELRRQNPEDG